MSDIPRTTSVHLSLAILAMAFGVFFASQIEAAKRNTETMTWQKDNFEKQLTQFKEGQKNVTAAIEQRKELVTQSQAVKEKYVQLFSDLLELSKTDQDAAEVVQKWKIQVNAPKPAEAKAEGETPKQ